jgi:lipoprotein signal peptidase
MIGLAAGLLLTPLLDLAIKAFLVRNLKRASAPLGPLGEIQVVRSRIWLARRGLHGGLLWSLWFLSAGTLGALIPFFPHLQWFAGLLLGGSLSHLLETTFNGQVIDYIRLRFWPAFNLADAAITIGALGILFQVVRTFAGGPP